MSQTKLVLTGAIVNIYGVESFDNNFSKRVFWLTETDKEKYPNTWALELWNDDTDLAKKFQPNDIVECQVDVIGKLRTKRNNGEQFIINTLRCRGIKKT